MKRIFTFILIILALGILAKSCLRRDVPYTIPEKIEQHDLKEINYPPDEKNVSIDGVDYLQSLAPAGKFGGELVISTIGEGPKTFNPCNTKDATSSEMAGLMYDGLVKTNPRTGTVEPLLAKSFEIGIASGHKIDYTNRKLRPGLPCRRQKPGPRRPGRRRGPGQGRQNRDPFLNPAVRSAGAASSRPRGRNRRRTLCVDW